MLSTTTLRKFIHRIVFFSFVIFFVTPVLSQRVHPLNKNIVYSSSKSVICYNNQNISLGPKAFYVDATLSEKDIANNKYIFNSVQEAVKHLSDGTPETPMTLYIAPYVYWLDNPDDTAIRVPKSGNPVPFGMEIKCEWLKLCGLADDPADVILASNRGQTMGAKGNFTMLKISGDGCSAENITFGNYCNLDLVYPLKTSLNRPKRGNAIVQAQLVFCNGDKVLVRNSRFISRLNLCPFVGSKRTLFERCHFELTDDALNGNAVYLNCTFDFFGSKPFWGTSGTGAVFLNCDISSYVKEAQYFVKTSGQAAVINARFYSPTVKYIGWKQQWDAASYYQYNNTLNGKPYLIGNKNRQNVGNIANKELLSAYVIQSRGKWIYNTYNLLRGDDAWDPMNVKEKIPEGDQNIPTQLLVTASHKKIETGKDTLFISTQFKRFGNYSAAMQKIDWEVDAPNKNLVTLISLPDGSCKVIPKNTTDSVQRIVVFAHSLHGLRAAVTVEVAPAMLPAPKIISKPIIKKDNKALEIIYKTDQLYADQSIINWYRCMDERGSNPTEVAVSRLNNPKKTYQLTSADVGYFLMATIIPKHIRSVSGEKIAVMYSTKISENDVTTSRGKVKIDLKSLSSQNQKLVKPGFWTLDSYTPEDTKEYGWVADTTKDAWYYGTGADGAASDTGFVQAVQGARMFYTPVQKTTENMRISFIAIPAKTAGQGFSSARAQYLDVLIKLDTDTKSGYGLRIIRTTKFSDAVDFVLMEYKNGVATAISAALTTSCFRPPCFIQVEYNENQLLVNATTTATYFQHPDKRVLPNVSLNATVTPNTFGGFGFLHTSTVPGGAVLIKNIEIESR